MKCTLKYEHRKCVDADVGKSTKSIQEHVIRYGSHVRKCISKTNIIAAHRMVIDSTINWLKLRVFFVYFLTVRLDFSAIHSVETTLVHNIRWNVCCRRCFSWKIWTCHVYDDHLNIWRDTMIYRLDYHTSAMRRLTDGCCCVDDSYSNVSERGRKKYS